MSVEHRAEMRRRIEMLTEEGRSRINEEIEEGTSPEEIYIEEIIDRLLESEFIYTHTVVSWWLEIPEYDSENYYGEPDIIAQMVQALTDYFEEELTPPLRDHLDDLVEAAEAMEND